MTWYWYELPPIDWWPIPTVKTVHEQSRRWLETDEGMNNGEIPELSGMWVEAQAVARKFTHWEGDVRQGPFVLFGPSESGEAMIATGFAWKQDNNGTTFIVNRFPFPQLDQNQWVDRGAAGRKRSLA